MKYICETCKREFLNFSDCQTHEQQHLIKDSLKVGTAYYLRINGDLVSMYSSATLAVLIHIYKGEHTFITLPSRGELSRKLTTDGSKWYSYELEYKYNRLNESIVRKEIPASLGRITIENVIKPEDLQSKLDSSRSWAEEVIRNGIDHINAINHFEQIVEAVNKEE